MLEEFFRNPNLTELDLNSFQLNLKEKLNKLQTKHLICELMDVLLLKNVYESDSNKLGLLTLSNLLSLPPERPIENCLVFNTKNGSVQILNLNCNHSSLIIEHFKCYVKCLAVYEGKCIVYSFNFSIRVK